MTEIASRTSRVGLGLAIAGCFIFAILVAAFVWQQTVHDSKMDEADSHATAASLLQSAETEGKTVGDLLQRYVASGDETLLPQIQSHSATGVQTLTAALAEAGADPNGFITQGSQLVQSAGQIIAMRQTGDVPGAVAALKDAAPKFNAFIAAQDQVIASERAEAICGFRRRR